MQVSCGVDTEVSEEELYGSVFMGSGVLCVDHIITDEETIREYIRQYELKIY